MYPPPHHQSNDIQQMIAVIKHYPFATLVSAKDNKPFITHIPIIYNDESGKLVAHIDKQNPQMETLVDGVEVTVIFKGPDCYISPSVYSTPQLPTWNYIIVHVTGKIKLITNPKAAKKTMVEMTDFLEGTDPKFQLKMDDPRMDRLINYIQAFDIEITNWEGKFKLSQDKNAEDFERAKERLIKKLPTESREFMDILFKK